MIFEDVVILLPGFLGFSRVGGFYYFADRVSATLRGAVEALNKGRTIPVVPICTLPIDRLAARQEKLWTELSNLCTRMGDVRGLHLVGHSAGGVDAQLLTCERPLVGERWSSDAERVRKKIKSVIGIAAPHHGTCLANAPLAQLVADPLWHFPFLSKAGRPLWDLVRLVGDETQLTDIVYSILHALPHTCHFLWQLIAHRGLIDNLEPRAMEATRAYLGKSNVLLRSFVTAIADLESPEPLFRDLYRLTADTSQVPANEVVRQSLVLLNKRSSDAIQSISSVITFDERINDGVVNSARQLLDPTNHDELAGIVVADHADVLGHYDRQDAFVGDKPLNRGLFHSGAGFGDDQFYALYRRVAEVLSGVISK